MLSKILTTTLTLMYSNVGAFRCSLFNMCCSFSLKKYIHLNDLSVEMPSSPHVFMCIRSFSVDLHVVFAVVASGKKTSLRWRGSRRKRSLHRLTIKPPQHPAPLRHRPLPATPPPLIPHSPTDSFRRTRGQPWPKGSSQQPCNFWQCSSSVWQSACCGFATYWRKAKGQGRHASSINIINRSNP